MAPPEPVTMTGPMGDITLRNQTESPLLRLPGELRNRIYELAVGGNIIVVSRPPKQQAKTSVYLVSHGTHGNTRGSVSAIFTIGLTCRQLYEETALHLYAKNVFHFKNVRNIRPFTNRLSCAQRALLASISIEVELMIGRKLKMYSDGSSTHSSITFLPNLERIYVITASLRELSSRNEIDVLNSIREELKIGMGRKEGVSLLSFDVFSGMENQDQEKAVKMNLIGEVPSDRCLAWIEAMRSSLPM